MNESDFIYKMIYTGALHAGARESSAKNAAVYGLSEYRKNRFETVPKLITEAIKQAKKNNL